MRGHNAGTTLPAIGQLICARASAYALLDGVRHVDGLSQPDRQITQYSLQMPNFGREKERAVFERTQMADAASGQQAKQVVV